MKDFFVILIAILFVSGVALGVLIGIWMELRATRKIMAARWDYDRFNKTVDHIWERLSPGKTIDKDDYYNTVLSILSQPKPIVRMCGKSTQSDKLDVC